MTDLRLYPRIPTTLMAELTNSLGSTQACRINNLSPGGLMLEGGEEVRSLIFEGHDPNRDPLTHPVELELRIQLPGQQQCFYSRARLLYVRRLSQLTFNMGFRYVAISAIHARMMEQYVFNGDPIKQPLNQASGSH